jgi:glycosyltransferase involved in cell wall biosynthesis
VLFVGNLSDQKKPFLLLDIFENLKDEEFNLVLIGSGLLEKSIKNEIKKRNIKNIQMLGHKSEDLVKYYVASDCLILPGLGGMVISEALASSLPVVMHKSDGVEYDLIINYKTGFRVKNANSKEFIKKIRYLKDNPDEREKMAYKCKKLIVEKFNTKNMVQKIIEAVDFSLQKRKGY